jgi:hypothetical protein
MFNSGVSMRYRNLADCPQGRTPNPDRNRRFQCRRDHQRPSQPQRCAEQSTHDRSERREPLTQHLPSHADAAHYAPGDDGLQDRQAADIKRALPQPEKELTKHNRQQDNE